MAHSISCTSESTFDELHDDGVNALVALPDNQHALSGSNDGTVKLFNVNDGASSARSSTLTSGLV